MANIIFVFILFFLIFFFPAMVDLSHVVPLSVTPACFSNGLSGILLPEGRLS